MYDALVKALRVCVDKDKGCDDCPYMAKCLTNKSGKHVAMVDAADAIKELQRRLEQALYMPLPRWIPVTERLPEQGKRYLVIRFDEVTKTQFIDILWHDAHDLWWNRLYKGQYNVTHWMPLPEPPKEET